MGSSEMTKEVNNVVPQRGRVTYASAPLKNRRFTVLKFEGKKEIPEEDVRDGIDGFGCHVVLLGALSLPAPKSPVIESVIRSRLSIRGFGAMKGTVKFVNQRKSKAAVETNLGYTIIEALGFFDLNPGDTITGELHSLGSKTMRCGSTDIRVWVDDIYCSLSVAQRILD